MPKNRLDIFLPNVIGSVIGATAKTHRNKRLRTMTKDEMKHLIRSLNRGEFNELRCLLTYGIDEWDRKTTINGEQFVCPACGGMALLEVMNDVIER